MAEEEGNDESMPAFKDTSHFHSQFIDQSELRGQSTECVLGGESHREELGYLQIVIRLGSPA
jgi:hypothetical protein